MPRSLDSEGLMESTSNVSIQTLGQNRNACKAEQLVRAQSWGRIGRKSLYNLAHFSLF